jgi:hypothetical protein
LTPFYNKSSDVGENTNKLKCGLNLLKSFTNRVTHFNKVCNILEERTMRRDTCKKLETRKGEKNGLILSWRAPPR